MVEKCLPAEEQGAEKNLAFQTKDVSSNSLSACKGFKFSKTEKLKKKTVIEDIFLKGKAIHKSGFAFLYLEQANSIGVPVQAMFAVSKRNFKHAVDRNKVKRRMREAWRLQKNKFYKTALQHEKQFAVCLIFKGKRLPDFKEAQTAIQYFDTAFARLVQR